MGIKPREKSLTRMRRNQFGNQIFVIETRRSLAIAVALILTFAFVAQASRAQSKPSSMAVKPPTPSPIEASPPHTTPKKSNTRPQVPETTEAADTSPATSALKRLYYYEFTQPDFIISRIVITHDSSGKGEISFNKSGIDEMISEPIEISREVLSRIESAFERLNFLQSDENYQYEKDYPHLGVIKIRVTDDGRSREAVFNWTENPDAKLLKDEYRRIGNQFLWIFDIGVARENQPLESPKLMQYLDSLLKRNEVADAVQMLPFLRTLADDERLPLIARNHAAKLAKQLEKLKK